MARRCWEGHAAFSTTHPCLDFYMNKPHMLRKWPTQPPLMFTIAVVLVVEWNLTPFLLPPLELIRALNISGQKMMSVGPIRDAGGSMSADVSYGWHSERSGGCPVLGSLSFCAEILTAGTQN